jgi:FkbH-like protein
VANAQGSAAGAAIRTAVSEGRFDDAWRALVPELLDGLSTSAWSVGRNVLASAVRAGWSPPVARRIRLAILCSYEASELREHLRLACLALRIDAEIYVAPYGQLEQELLAQESELAAFRPTHVLLAPTTADLGFPELAQDGEALIAEAEARWEGLWRLGRERLAARVIQHSFVVPDESPLGHLSLRLPASRISLVRELDRRLAARARQEVLLVDAERLAARLGKHRWEDPRLWYAARRPFSAEALVLLARETAAVLAADQGLAARCLVVDLDNTLWGGVVGDDGADGIVLGEGPDGEAYTAFQEYLAALGQRGLILAVASKNDPAAAREPFEGNPDMRLSLEDFAVFVADWRPKSEQLAEIAQRLGIGLDAILFADDNPAECAEVAAALPEVDTVCLDVPPSERVRRLAASLRLELTWLSAEDLQRQHSYAARSQAASLRNGVSSIEDFWRSLDMRAHVRALDRGSLDRAAQLTQKTNQFNLTLNRRTREEIERLAGRDGAICMTLELEDRFARHGLIGLGMLTRSDEDPDTALIDTLLLSCRVIGRTAEVHLLSHLGRQALQRGFARLRGVYVPGPRNALVSDLYPRLGFAPVGEETGCWEYDLADKGPLESLYIADRP